MYYVDFACPANNDFTAISQFKVRIPGTEHHILPDIVLILNDLPVTMHYAQPYLGGSKHVILLGIAFDKASRTIGDWQHEVIAQR